MKYSKIRVIVASVLFVVLAICLAAGISTGSLCGLGWNDITALCPLGALYAMIASRSIIPPALICVAVGCILAVLLGRAFCGWICPVSIWDAIRQFFKRTDKRKVEESAKAETCKAIGEQEIAKSLGHSCTSCGICAKKHGKLDSRHAVLGGTILATAIFGFPVFCLICPVGLSFALVAVLVALFSAGDLNWMILLIPAMLVIEVVFLRQWCSSFCPISALISLLGRFSKTGKPQIDNAKCLETTTGTACGSCAAVCKYGVNLRHPEYGDLPVYDCSRCMECIDVCPANAISIALINDNPQPFIVKAADFVAEKTGGK